MTTPTITAYPGDIPAKGQSNTVFDTNVDAYLVWLSTLNIPELQALVPFLVGLRDEVAATALSGTLPTMSGKAADFFRVNAGETAVEFRTAAEVLGDIGAPTVASVALKAPIASPTFTGVPAVPTATASTDTTQVASTAFVLANAPKAGYGTQVATTSGTAFDFTGIPSSVNKVTMISKGVSLSGADLVLIQLGTSGGIVTSGYAGAGGAIISTNVNEESSTSGLAIRLGTTRGANGSVVFTRMSSGGTVWSAQGVSGDSNGVFISGASVDIGGELTQVRLTRDASDTFVSGAANISWSY